jgi:hypothetical protein
MPLHGYDPDEDDDKSDREGPTFKEFDCPGCNANNPCETPFGEGSQIMCNYCGMEWDVIMRDGKIRFREH